ncbi:hypothetical protein [Saccharopolyspora shandongensis]|uniref:hypothetical protein n=1 Tax=Saccharopolyspora shandongensis TaxID=418495 RepID=UPI0033C9210C
MSAHINAFRIAGASPPATKVRLRSDLSASTQALEVVEPGLQTTVQDHPGRLGRQWKVGRLRPGRDVVTFREVDLEQAAALDAHTRRLLDARTLEVR